MPQVTGGPDALNTLLESAYDKCIKDGGDETSCSKVAWSAAEKAGWKKYGDKWEKMDMAEIQLENMGDVEIIYDGKFRPQNLGGREVEITKADVKAIMENTRKYAADTGVEPYLKLEHGEDGTFLPALLKSTSLGYVDPASLMTRAVEKLGRVRDVVVSTLKGMPSKFKELITKGLIKKRSAEIRHRDGYGPVLDALAFFGIGHAAVPALNDLSASLTAMQEDAGLQVPALPDDKGTVTIIEFEAFDENKKTRKTQMDENVKLSEYEQENKELRDKIAELEKVQAVNSVQIDLKEEVAKAKAEADRLKTELTALAVLRDKEREIRLAEFVEKQIAEKKLKPALKDKTIALFKAIGDKEELVVSLKEILTEQEVDPRFKEVIPGNSAPRIDPDDKAALVDQAKLMCKEHKKDPDNLDDFQWAIAKLIEEAR
jgi:hypothetical protein